MTDHTIRLLELLRTHSFAEKRVLLASGRESDFFIDVKQTALLAEGHALVGQVMLERLGALPGGRPVAVAGVALGGCPLASAVAQASFGSGAPVDALYVRKEAKDHGSARAIEGGSHLPRNARIAVLEDVITTGGSTLRAIDQLADLGYDVAGVVVLVDRREGGAEALRAAGHPVVSVFGREDFFDGR